MKIKNRICFLCIIFLNVQDVRGDERDNMREYGCQLILRHPGDAKKQALGRGYIKKAADLNDPGAMLEYAVLLNEGIGGSRSQREALKYFKRAAGSENAKVEVRRLAAFYVARLSYGPECGRDLLITATDYAKVASLLNHLPSITLFAEIRRREWNAPIEEILEYLFYAASHREGGALEALGYFFLDTVSTDQALFERAREAINGHPYEETLRASGRRREVVSPVYDHELILDEDVAFEFFKLAQQAGIKLKESIASRLNEHLRLKAIEAARDPMDILFEAAKLGDGDTLEELGHFFLDRSPISQDLYEKALEVIQKNISRMRLSISSLNEDGMGGFPVFHDLFKEDLAFYFFELAQDQGVRLKPRILRRLKDYHKELRKRQQIQSFEEMSSVDSSNNISH